MKLVLVRPTATHSLAVLWLKTLLDTVLFFSIFHLLLPWLAHSLAPAPLPFHGRANRFLGAAVCVTAALLWLRCLDVFVRQGLGTPFPLDAPRRLMARGPYAVVRNPLIAAEIAIIWGLVLYFGSLGLFLYALIATAAGHSVVVRVEEPELRRRFGPEYVEYLERVPRWIPRFSRSTRSPRPSDERDRHWSDGGR
jgi:protein-S-isoprenylcysteine O-methyltransferase Ste14